MFLESNDVCAKSKAAQSNESELGGYIYGMAYAR